MPPWVIQYHRCEKRVISPPGSTCLELFPPRHGGILRAGVAGLAGNIFFIYRDHGTSSTCTNGIIPRCQDFANSYFHLPGPLQSPVFRWTQGLLFGARRLKRFATTFFPRRGVPTPDVFSSPPSPKLPTTPLASARVLKRLSYFPFIATMAHHPSTAGTPVIIMTISSFTIGWATTVRLTLPAFVFGADRSGPCLFDKERGTDTPYQKRRITCRGQPVLPPQASHE